MTIAVYKYTVPYYGDILIHSGICSNCNYVYRNVDQLSGSEPRKVIYRVEKPEDVNALVIKSVYAKIEIPELGLTVDSGIASQGYITTVEGLILEFIDVVKSLCEEKKHEITKCEELLEKLEKARNGELEYTIVIYDYVGISDIISNKTVREKIEIKNNL